MVPRPNTSVLLHQLVHLSLCSPQSLIGPLGFIGLFTHLCCPQPSLFLLRVLSRTRFFPRNGNSSPSSNGAFSSGADKTAFHPCPNQRFGYWAPNCGHPTYPTSPTTSPAHPSNNWSNSFLVRFSTAKISTPLLSASFVRAYTIRPLKKTFLDPEVFASIPHAPQYITSTLVDHLLHKYGRSYPWAIGKGRQLPSGYILAKKKKDFTSGRPIISFVDAPFDRC